MGKLVFFAKGEVCAGHLTFVSTQKIGADIRYLSVTYPLLIRYLSVTYPLQELNSIENSISWNVKGEHWIWDSAKPRLMIVVTSKGMTKGEELLSKFGWALTKNERTKNERKNEKNERTCIFQRAFD